MFNHRKKKSSAAAGKTGHGVPPPSAKLKHSLLSLEQRLMFDAAAAATASEVASEQVAQEQAEAAMSSDAPHEATGGEKGGGEAVVQALTTYMPAEKCVEVAFVDPTVPNYQDMLTGMDPNIEVIMLDGGQDGVEQMAEALSGRTGIDAIHLISHGSSGELQLGTGTLTTESMSSEYADEFATIRGALSAQADLLVYGCNFGEGVEGADAVNLLAEITGADVAASSDGTGHIDLGGDWEFEVQAGSIEADLALTDATQMNWVGILGTETVADTFSDKSYGNDDGTSSWSSSWSEVDRGASGADGGHIKVNSGELRIETQVVGASVSRGVDLSGARSATLSFAYNNDLDRGGSVEVRISTDGGANYRPLSDGTFSKTSHTGSGTASFDISDHMSADTKIQFLVTGTSGGDRLFIDNVQVDYHVADANTAPTDLTLSGSTVAENAATGTVVGTVSGTDPDASDTKHYSLTDTAGGRFAINSATGVLTVADGSLLNAEASASHSVTVRVTDAGGQTYDETFTLAVTNVNEGPTDLTLVGSTVAENAATGTVVGTVSETDPDAGDTKTYSLTDTAGGRFAINSATGQLTVADGSLLNYESATSHTVTVQVTDSGGQSYTETFTINLTNVNEAPTITSNGGGASAVVNVAENQTDVTLVTAMDGDAGATLAYSIAGGPDAARFSIDSTTGALRFSTAPDFERPSDVGRNNTYDVTVRVSDGQGGTVTQTISVHVTDVNEAPRIISNRGGDAAPVTIRENRTTVTNVRATDPDGGARMTYSVVGGADAALFTINPNTGFLRFSSAPNFERPTDTDHNNVYQVVVQASDGRGGTDSQVISVRVTNVNETPTDLSFSARSVAENATTGTVVGIVTGSDPDSRDTKSYSLTDTAGGRFAINSSTGVITVANGALLNYESAQSHNITVQVTDRGGLTYCETFRVDLTNTNDAPTDLALSANTVMEHATTGTVVGTVSGTDPDVNDTKTYRLTDTAGGRFAIDPATGVLRVADGSLLNYEAAPSHTVMVQVMDSGGLSYTKTFTINLTNIDEGATDLSLSASTVTEQATTETVMGTVSGTTPAVGDTRPEATTDPSEGQSATDHTSGGLSSDATSTSPLPTVTEASTPAPVSVAVSGERATQLVLSINTIAENAATGTVVGTVSGTASAVGETRTYSLTESAGDRFAINSETGVLTVADGSLVGDGSATSHTVTVQVTESSGQIYYQTFSIHLTNVNEAPSAQSRSSFLIPTHPMATNGDSAVASTLGDRSSGGKGMEFRPPEDMRKAVETTMEMSSPVKVVNSEGRPASAVHEEFHSKVALPVEARDLLVPRISMDEMGVTVTAEDAGGSALRDANQADDQQPERTTESAIDVGMTVGLAGVVLQGGVGAKEKLIAMTRRFRASSAQAPYLDVTSQPSCVSEESLPSNESEHTSSDSRKSGAS